MHSLDLNKYTSMRLNPSQMRGKERIRVILAATIRVFREKGIDQTTTNDIAETANVPIGSVYRYFKNKEEIIMAITDLYVKEVVFFLEEIGDNPLLNHMEWDEILTIVTDAWAHHTLLNDSFTFIYFLQCNRQLAEHIRSDWQKVSQAFYGLLKKRDQSITPGVATIYLQLTWSVVELSTQDSRLMQTAINVLARALKDR